MRFGAGHPELPNIPAHSPYFDFDEGVLPIGAAFLAQVALQTLQQKEIFTDPVGDYSPAMLQPAPLSKKGKR